LIQASLFVFLLLNALVLVLTEALIVFHVVNWFKTHFVPFRVGVMDEVMALTELMEIVEELSDFEPSLKILQASISTAGDVLDITLFRLRTGALVRCVAGVFAMMVAPAASAFFIGNALLF
jgi:hypothetical protein